MIDELRQGTSKITEAADEFSKKLRKADTSQVASLTTNISLILLCVIAAFVSIWDVEMSFQKAQSLCWITVFMYIVTTTVYRTKYNDGLFRGKQTKKYLSTSKDYEQCRQKVYDNCLMDPLFSWCMEYRRKELDDVRMELIYPYMSFLEYKEKYMNLPNEEIRKLKLSSPCKKAIMHANRIKPIVLHPGMLLSGMVSHRFGIFGNRSILPQSGASRRRFDFTMAYASRAVTTILCGMVVLSVIASPSWDSLLRWVVRMLPVLMSYIFAPVAGFNNAVDVDVKHMEVQTQLLDQFFSNIERKKENDKPNA